MIDQSTACARFDAVWAKLFESPIHLDSALAKEPREVRARIADVIEAILRRPRSLAARLGVKLEPGEPWSLAPDALAKWRPAQVMASRLISDPLNGDLEGEVLEDFPPCIVEELVGELGENKCRATLELLGSNPPLVLRAARALGAASLIEALVREERVDRGRIAPSRISPLGVAIDGHLELAHDPSFLAGDFEIQDDGAQVLALLAIWPEAFASLLRAHPGPSTGTERPPDLPSANKRAPLTIIDGCAGAGGKSLAIADALENSGRIFAYDISKPKLDALRRRAKRAGLTNVKTVVVEEGRESELASKFAASADMVLVDAPCSGWGVLRRNPDAKWRIDPSSFARLRTLQGRLLDAYAPLVRPGGRLVYVVCTIRADETRGVADAFAARHPELVPGIGGFLGPGPSDGFYVRAFERVG